VAATFDNRSIRVMIPASIATAWIESDRTGIEASTATLRLLIERIFSASIVSRTRKTRFPNPLASTG
jgi:hypothetical protein